MKLKIKNDTIKQAVEYENTHNLFKSTLEEGGRIYQQSTAEQVAMNILYGYISSLHEVSEFPEVQKDIDLTYDTVKNVIPAVGWEFAAGMGNQCSYTLEQNIEIAEKTIAAYFMLLAVNDDTAEIVVDPQIVLEDIDKPDRWPGFQVKLINRFSGRDLLKDIHGCVTFRKNVLKIEVEKLVSAYKAVTGKDLTDYGMESMIFESEKW